MKIRLFKSGDLPKIHKLLLSNTWEFFVKSALTQEDILIRDEKYFFNDSNQTLVLVDDGENVKGYIRFFEIENAGDSSALFNIRIDSDSRGKGQGTLLVREGVKYIFGKYNKIRRIEATTRFDNIAMQKVLEVVGFKNEARYRKAWKISENEYVDSLGYGLIREEFESK